MRQRQKSEGQLASKSCPWVGRHFSVFSALGCVGSTTAKVLKIGKDCIKAFKARLDKIWLHREVKFISCTGLGPNFYTCSGLGSVGSVSSWVWSNLVTQNGPVDNW